MAVADEPDRDAGQSAGDDNREMMTAM